MKLVRKARRIIAGMMAASMMLGGVIITNPTEVHALERTQGAVKRNVMYYGDWSVWGGQDNFYPQDIPADQLTHLNFAFLDFDAQGNLIFTDKDAATGNPLGQAGVTWGDVNAGILPALVELRAKNPNLKIGVSIGGWSKSGDFSEMAANPTYRANFVNNVMKFVEYTGMDFVDIDWEYPGDVRQPDLVDNRNDEGTPNARPEDKENYILLLQDLRDALDKKEVELGKTFELSVALPAARGKLEAGVDIQRMFEIIDFGNLMTYDMRGAWDPVSGHQTGLYPNSNDPYKENGLTIDETVMYMLANGAPAEKLVIGAAYYTRGWEQVSGGTDSNNPGVFGEAAVAGKDADFTPSRGAANELPMAVGDGGRRGGVWSYRNIDKLKQAYPGLKEYWDDEAKAPYLYDQTTGAFFTYDNVKSIEEKTKYVNENELGGVIGWMASNDAPTTSTKRDELTKATKKGLFGNGKLTEHEIVYTDLDIDVALSAYESQWGTGGGYEISITNNERLEESGEVLGLTEKMAETITLPKIYIKHSAGNLTSGGYEAGVVTQEGDYTVVDLGAIYDGKQIAPGKTYTFKLNAPSGVPTIEAIESIEVAQRVSKTGEEIKRQTIYGDVDAVNQAPVIKGVEDKVITIGTPFDAMEGVTALDREDGDLTPAIIVKGEVDTDTLGDYVLAYEVTDSKGLKTSVTRKVTVEEQAPNQAPVLRGVTDKTIEVGTSFNAMEGVIAHDAEEGDITSRIALQGEVDTNTEGNYVLTYTVADREGAEVSATRTITVEEKQLPTLPESDFGVGEGIEWPTQVNAPFVDMCLWTGDQDYANNGVIDLAKISEETGVKFFNLGFIQALGGTQPSGDKLNWAWGGFPTLNETSTDKWQYEGIKKSIKEVRQAGGDVTISLGGLNGQALWEATEDVDVLTNTYMELVTGYGLTRLDLDIEGGAQGKERNRINAEAIKRVQDATGIQIVLTLPVMPDGLTNLGTGTVEAFLEAGVDVSVINLMTMCYGASVPDYAVGSVQAVDSVMEQLKAMYRGVGITLTDEEVYAKLGTTPSIGFETEAHPIFTVEQSKMVVDHAIEKGLAMTSFWSLNRDSKLQDNTGVPSKYAFTEVFKAFGQETAPEVNTKPVIRGAEDTVVTVGDAFDKMEGVTAYDKEDGDLTNSVNVTGEVDTEVAGDYILTYSVVDSKGLETTVTRTITVEEKVNAAPVITGATDVTLTVGDTFDKMAGVTADDKEDGDLTDRIVVSGEVDTAVAADYQLTYSVVDSEGAETSVTRTVTVQEKANVAPVITGATDITLTVDDAFDVLEGVTAHDEEDGDLTDKIVVTGEVDTAVAGEYQLTYSVVDSEGLETVVTRIITVVAKPDPNNTYDPNKQYNAGDKVMYNGKEYTAKWWTQGETPGEAEVWEVKVEPNPDGSQDYIPGKAYVEGDIVHYNGKNYIAKWWTTSIPGSDDSWEVEGGNDNGVYVPGTAYVGGDTVTYEGVTYRAKWWTTSTPGSDDSWERI